MDDKIEETKRGWVFDLLMDIGHAEAKLTHQDENICNDYHDMKENSGDEEEIERLADDIATRHEVEELVYTSRAKDLDFLFDAIPNSDRHWLCDVKHDAARFILSAEVYHASGFDPKMEESMVTKGEILAITCSKAFNMEVMDCLRCLNDALNAKLGFDQTHNILAELPKDDEAKVTMVTASNGGVFTKPKND